VSLADCAVFFFGFFSLIVLSTALLIEQSPSDRHQRRVRWVLREEGGHGRARGKRGAPAGSLARVVPASGQS